MEGSLRIISFASLLFCCYVSNGMKQWFISIVPLVVQPGTSQDIDFYSMPEECYYPLKNGWSKSSERGKESTTHHFDVVQAH
jgi:hypothetical protein